MLDVPSSGLYLAFTGDADRVGKVRANALEMLSAPIRPVGFAIGGDVSFAVHRHGGDDILALPVVDEIFAIAREAVTNAFRHSEATRINVELDYQTREFRMTGWDNGRGFDVDAMLAATTNGHWGLRGMASARKRLAPALSVTALRGRARK
jgi:signal transduction histidine kinase